MKNDLAVSRSFLQRRTLARSVNVTGVGLHSGTSCSVTLYPGSNGITFRRRGAAPSPLSMLETIATDRCTRVGFPDGSRVDTVEHLVAALSIAGITDVVVEMTGEETPILDGSSLPWLHEMSAVGVIALPGPAARLEVVAPFEFSARGAHYSVAPGALAYDVTIDFPAASIGRQNIRVEDGFIGLVADSRTFVLEHEIEALRAAGLALGGGLHNAVVIGSEGPINPEGFRHRDECVRHKTLDLIGDLFMFGLPVIGDFTVSRPGHAANGEFLRAMSAAGILEHSGSPACRAA